MARQPRTPLGGCENALAGPMSNLRTNRAPRFGPILICGCAPKWAHKLWNFILRIHRGGSRRPNIVSAENPGRRTGGWGDESPSQPRPRPTRDVASQSIGIRCAELRRLPPSRDPDPQPPFHRLPYRARPRSSMPFTPTPENQEGEPRARIEVCVTLNTLLMLTALNFRSPNRSHSLSPPLDPTWPKPSASTLGPKRSPNGV
jgi:hypothetical protein